MIVSGLAGVFLQRNKFPGNAALVAMLTLPLAFPGVVIGFMVIVLAGRQGLIGDISQALTGEKIVFAYSMAGLFMGYVYFSIPRTILTVMATAEKLDPRLEEAARSLGASPWRVIRDVIIPGLKPAFISAGAICFATAMGAFGTAFTLATRINVLPMVIYTEFTLRGQHRRRGGPVVRARRRHLDGAGRRPHRRRRHRRGGGLRRTPCATAARSSSPSSPSRCWCARS